MKTSFAKSFLILLVVLVIFACYLVFRPFLKEILIAAILVSIFYTPYQWLVRRFRGKKYLASFVMCVLVLLIIIIPITNLIIYAGEKSIEAYSDTVKFLENKSIDDLLSNEYIKKIDIIDSDDLEAFVMDIARQSSNWIVSGATSILKGTTSFIFSLLMIIFTMFFFFAEGKEMLQKIMYWSPLPNRYDLEIFKKFRDVSYLTIISTFVTAIAQGLIGAIGFIIVGFPAFFAGLLIALFSLVPYIGSMIIYVPIGIYLILIGDVWQGVFVLSWGMLIVGSVDNLIRAYMIRGKAKVSPIFIIFSILGGISLFGFWGVILGPLIISLAVTVFHIYEMEYEHILEK